MKLILDAAEIVRAVQHYAASKVGGTKADDFRVTVQWRGRTAVVDRVRPAVPVLNEVVRVPVFRAGGAVVETIEYGKAP